MNGTRRILFLNGRPLPERPLRRWLGDGPELFLITSRAVADRAARQELDAFQAVHLVEDYDSPTVERLAVTLGRRHAVTHLVSCQEDDVVRAARIRRRLDLPGQTPHSAVAYRDKLTMRRLAEAAGIRQPSFTEITTAEQIKAFVDHHGLPAVIKPRYGSGSRGVHILRTPGELAALPIQMIEDGALIETFVDAPFFHLDGITVQGRVLYCWPSAYTTGNAEATRTGSPLISEMLPPTDPAVPILYGFAARVHAALPAPPYPTGFHLEAWLPGDAQPILCEVAARPTGPPIAETFDRAFGANLIAEHLRGQSGVPLRLTVQPTRPATRLACLRLLRGHGTFSPPPPCPIPGASLRITLPAGATGTGPQHVADRTGYAIIEAHSAARLHARTRDFLTWWEAARPWSSESTAQTSSAY